ncbi:MAG: class I SAM-dependent methyltransferase [Chloroflexi bacterium]|nr:class I SAM-dependent methyltransferase [Chloroflexota bacterium]
MDHSDHVKLLRDGVLPGGEQVWADFGAGWGAFTLALADLLDRPASIHAIDQNRAELGRLQRSMMERFPQVNLITHPADFNQALDLPPLDGLVMANSLHFQTDHLATVQRLARYLKPSGRFLIVEYNIKKSRPWVPYPVSYGRWQHLADQAALGETRKLGSRPSRSTREIYSAGSWRN